MYCTVKEIIREVLDTDVPDSECVFAVVLTRGDVRHIAQDWSLTDDELETVMQRLDDAFERQHCSGRCSWTDGGKARQPSGDSSGGDTGKSDGAGRQ